MMSDGRGGNRIPFFTAQCSFIRISAEQKKTSNALGDEEKTKSNLIFAY